MSIWVNDKWKSISTKTELSLLLHVTSNRLDRIKNYGTILHFPCFNLSSYRDRYVTKNIIKFTLWICNFCHFEFWCCKRFILSWYRSVVEMFWSQSRMEWQYANISSEPIWACWMRHRNATMRGRLYILRKRIGLLCWEKLCRRRRHWSKDIRVVFRWM